MRMFFRCIFMRILIVYAAFIAAGLFIGLQANDNYPPKFEISGSCGEYTVKVADQNPPTAAHPDHKDIGISQLPTIFASKSFNFDSIRIYPKFRTDSTYFEFSFSLNVIDKFQDAFVQFLCSDKAGNVVSDTIRYYADAALIEPDVADFGKVRVGSDKDIIVTIKSEAARPFKILSVRTSSGNNLFVTAQKCPPEIEILPNQQQFFNLIYYPQKIVDDEFKGDFDTLLIRTECLTYRIPLSGKGVRPLLSVGNFAADVVTIGETLCNDSSSMPAKNFRITNPGNDTLHVYGIDPPGLGGAFKISDPTSPAFPFAVPPGDSVFLKSVCYVPAKAGEDSILVNLITDAADCDSAVSLRGLCVNPGPYITGLDLDLVPIGRQRVQNVYVRNSGRKPVKVTGCYLAAGIDDFKILYDNISPKIDNGYDVLLYPRDYGGTDQVKEIAIPIQFTSKTEFERKTRIFLKLDPAENIHSGSIYNYLTGYGIEPKMAVTGYSFKGRTLVNTFAPDTGHIIISSISKTTELFIKDIRFASNSPNSQDFQLNYSFPQGGKLLLRGRSIDIPVRFIPSDSGQRNASIIIVSNSGPTPSDNVFNYDTVCLSGTGFFRGVKTNNLFFNNVLLCSDTIVNLNIENLSTTDTARVLDIRFVENSRNFFSILHDFSASPLDIPPSLQASIPVRFAPEGGSPGGFRTTAKIILANDTLLVFMEGRSRMATIRFSMNDLKSIPPGAQTISLPDDGLYDSDFKISAECPELGRLAIDSLRIQIFYKSRWMIFSGITRKGSVIDEWSNIKSSVSEYDDSLSILTIEASGATPLSSEGVLFMPVFTMLLSERSIYEPYFGDISLYSRSDCAAIEKRNGKISLYTCTDELGNIIIGPHHYLLSYVTPNPSISGKIQFTYSLPFEEKTRIVIYNGIGCLVSTIENSTGKPGTYSIEYDTSALSPGSYFIIMECGPYKEVRPFIVGFH